jgi:polar amino acid transport system permease protein
VIARKTRITALDIFLGGLLLGAAVYFFYRIRVDLTYNWKWEVVPQYLFRFDSDSQRWVPAILMQGFFTTLRLSIWATLLATLIGTVMGLLKASRRLFNRLVSGTYVEMTRNLPPLVLIFVFYFFVSDQLLPPLGLEEWLRNSDAATQKWVSLLFAPPALLNSFLSALITLSIFEGAYVTEIVRSGIQSIERGQWEASAALGLSKMQQMRHVILPQAVRRILPALAGQFISTIKDSAIVSVISIQELTYQGMALMASTYLTFEVWITISAMYLVLTLFCSLSLEQLELFWRRRSA